MTPDKICELLSELGASVSRRTLLHYEELELIPRAVRGGGGKQGRFSDYPEETCAEAYAAWSLLHGKWAENFFGGPVPKFSPKAIRAFRNQSLEIQESHFAMEELKAAGYDNDGLSTLATEEEKAEFIRQMELEEANTSEYNKLKEDIRINILEMKFRMKMMFIDLWELEVLNAKRYLKLKGLI